MRRLSRYVLSGFSRTFLLALVAFVGLYLLVDFFEKVDDFLTHDAGLAACLGYFGSKIPLMLGQVTPMAVLMAVFMTLGGLSRTNELTAMRAAGLSLGRIALPLLATSLGLAATLLVLEETVLPLAARASRDIWTREVQKQGERAFRQQDLWLRSGRTVQHFRLVDPQQGMLYGIELIELDEQFRILSRTEAERALFLPGGWQLLGALIRRFDPATGALAEETRVAELPLALELRPADFQQHQMNPRDLSLRDHLRLQRRYRQEGLPPRRLEVDLQTRLAAPFSCLVMAFLGVPFALQKGRRSGLAMGLAISVGVGISFFILTALLTAIGYNGALPPVVAAWAPNLLFVLLGIWLLMVRE